MVYYKLNDFSKKKTIPQKKRIICIIYFIDFINLIHRINRIHLEVNLFR